MARSCASKQQETDNQQHCVAALLHISRRRWTIFTHFYYTLNASVRCEWFLVFCFMKKEIQMVKGGHFDCKNFDACSSYNVIGSDFRSHAFMQSDHSYLCMPNGVCCFWKTNHAIFALFSFLLRIWLQIEKSECILRPCVCVCVEAETKKIKLWTANTICVPKSLDVMRYSFTWCANRKKCLFFSFNAI